ncbi:hypothetical protein PENSTE_c013G05253 [Penicillium steckii]|uniref:ribonuclease H n=1 Tax=Penicillium steckii TaxID=303698 RepID=A0A1V6T322_9EURO|nr:hypothetical protein PENSTE_c013G05253 [Penicillium steckii]
MVYIMRFYTDGACRRNGQPGATGAAAAVLMKRGGGTSSWFKKLPANPRPTNQRAEITAIIIALQQALVLFRTLQTDPRLDITIYSDSRYAVNCMNEWVYKWCSNGWINSAGFEVANRDLIEEASNLDDQLKEEGSVQYKWIPREDNQIADELCNQVLDDLEC